MMKSLLVLAALVGLTLAAARPVSAQEPFRRPGFQDPIDSGSDYSSVRQFPPPLSDSSTVQANIYQRAQEYAAQRRARLAAMNWYGMSNARPTASPTPFSSIYSPVWEMPGDPFAWYPTLRPNFQYYTR